MEDKLKDYQAEKQTLNVMIEETNCLIVKKPEKSKSSEKHLNNQIYSILFGFDKIENELDDPENLSLDKLIDRRSVS